MRRVVALVGLSGVGKSTLVRRLVEQIPLLHLQASDLIKAEQARRQTTASSSEELRTGPVLDNQQLLIDGFARASASVDGLVLFDGHAVIFGDASVTDVPSSVFAALTCEQILMIWAEPGAILQRRLNDTRRIRPELDAGLLEQQQRRAGEAAARIASELGIPFACFSSEDVHAVVEALRA
ncbi:ATP-binding protein [uncultured Enterovirga sp.]|uniref:ATP-binding protein n=1 Tax=uncultured Enterovirga sp. TaxID=2026352 RepID=UPI0035CA7C3B